MPISLLGLCSQIHLFPNISYSRFYICTACFTQTSQLPHWLVPELEMSPANQSAARRKYINNCTLYFAPAQRTFTEPDCCGPCYNFTKLDDLLTFIKKQQQTKEVVFVGVFMISISFIILDKLMFTSDDIIVKPRDDLQMK